MRREICKMQTCKTDENRQVEHSLSRASLLQWHLPSLRKRVRVFSIHQTFVAYFLRFCTIRSQDSTTRTFTQMANVTSRVLFPRDTSKNNERYFTLSGVCGEQSRRSWGTVKGARTTLCPSRPYKISSSFSSFFPLFSFFLSAFRVT